MHDRTMTTDADIFFTDGCGRCNRFASNACTARIWGDGIATLRRICLSLKLRETAKWGHPCYMHAGRNIALIATLRNEFRLNFFKAGLLTDPERLLIRQGPNTQTADTIIFTDVEQAARLEPVLRAYLSEAMDYATRGILPGKTPAAVDMPDELTAALDDDPMFAKGFHALTPGRQRGWTLHYAGAKKSQTRASRIAKSRARVLAGKGWNER